MSRSARATVEIPVKTECHRVSYKEFGPECGLDGFASALVEQRAFLRLQAVSSFFFLPFLVSLVCLKIEVSAVCSVPVIAPDIDPMVTFITRSDPEFSGIAERRLRGDA